MEMSDKVKPLTSFFIEDILSFNDTSSARIRGKCCSQERSPEWEEEPETLSEKLCPQDAALGERSGELVLKFFQ